MGLVCPFGQVLLLDKFRFLVPSFERDDSALAVPGGSLKYLLPMAKVLTLKAGNSVGMSRSLYSGGEIHSAAPTSGFVMEIR
jgi:hypothetical protein